MAQISKEEKIARARELYLSGFNCSQSIVAAFAPEMGMEESLALRLSGAFGGGMGGLRGVCGAVSGMFMIYSVINGFEQPDLDAKKRLYSDVQALAGSFKEKYGTYNCGELLKLNGILATNTPAERTPEYYKARPCGRYIEYCAGLLADALNERANQA